MNKLRKDPATAGGCDLDSPSRRTRYYRDKRMRAADYELEQAYHVSRRRLINRAMLGWGVIQGFHIDEKKMTVGPGVALDPRGRELVACEEVALDRCDAVLWLKRDEGGRGLTVDDPPARAAESKADCRSEPDPAMLYLLAAHYAEKRVDSARIEDGCGGVRIEANQVCETVVFSLRPVTRCEIGLPLCRCQHCVNQRAGTQEGGEHIRLNGGRTDDVLCGPGNPRQLTQWSLDPLEGFDPCRTRGLEGLHCLSVDFDAGVPLAGVTIGFECGEPRMTTVVDDFYSRQLARTHKVLFDLIRGCHLTRIEDVSWKECIDKGLITFSSFQDLFIDPRTSPDTKEKALRTNFTVTFNAPVRSSTLTPDVVTLTLISREKREAVESLVRIPVLGLEPNPSESCDPKDTTRGFTVLIDRRFWYGEISSEDASGFETETAVEIEVRTDRIIGCNGQEVAGGGRLPPSTSTVPGGRFLTNFTVQSSLAK